MNIQIFVCFHNIIHDIYKFRNSEETNYITFYGVRDKFIDDTKKIIYECELTNYNSQLQKNKYNEGSCIYHAYINNLHNKFDYVGFCQYDMIFQETFFENIENLIQNNSNTIFYLGLVNN